MERNPTNSPSEFEKCFEIFEKAIQEIGNQKGIHKERKQEFINNSKAYSGFSKFLKKTKQSLVEGSMSEEETKARLERGVAAFTSLLNSELGRFENGGTERKNAVFEMRTQWFKTLGNALIELDKVKITPKPDQKIGGFKFFKLLINALMQSLKSKKKIEKEQEQVELTIQFNNLLKETAKEHNSKDPSSSPPNPKPNLNI